MATIRKRELPSGLIRWQVDFTDQSGKRRSKLFERRKDADVYLVKIRPLVANNTFLADGESITVAAAAQNWLDHCTLRCQTKRRMERATLYGYKLYVRLHLNHPEIGIGDRLIAQLARRHVNEFRDRLLLAGRSEHLTRRAITTLKMVLDHAIDNGYLFTNVAGGVKVIRASRIDYKAPVPSKETIRGLISSPASSSRRWRAFAPPNCAACAGRTSTSTRASSTSASAPMFMARWASPSRAPDTATSRRARWC